MPKGSSGKEIIMDALLTQRDELESKFEPIETKSSK